MPISINWKTNDRLQQLRWEKGCVWKDRIQEGFGEKRQHPRGELISLNYVRVARLTIGE
jgi:hypothetical protein